MAVENANYLSTPEGYATPEQIKNVRAYAQALLYGNMQQPVRHWSQGISNMVSALVGGNLDYQAAQKEQGGRNAAAEQQQTLIPGSHYPKAPVGTNPEMPKPSFSEGPSSGGVKKAEGDTDATVTSVAPDDVMSRASKATASIESGSPKGNYRELGPIIPKTGDRAYGKYQVMGANLPEWSSKYLGRTLTPEQFLADPQAQEDLYKAKFGEYIQKYGPEGAAKAWFAGEKGMKNPNAKDILGTTVQGYGQRFMKAYGPDDASVKAAPAVQAMSAALRGDASDAGGPGTEVAAAGGKIAPPPAGNHAVYPAASGVPYINPALIKSHTGHTADQLRAVLANPWVPQHIKDFAYQKMLQRDQVGEMASPTGMGTIKYDPLNPANQQYFAPKPEIKEQKIGDIQSPVLIGADTKGMPTTINPARAQPAPIVPSVGPRSEAPTAAPQGGPAVAGGPAPAMAENAPAAPVSPANAPESAEAPSQPVQVAATDPTAGISATAPKGPVPPAGGAPKEQPPLTRMAQSTPPSSLIDPEMWRAYTGKQAHDTKVAVDKQLQEKTDEQAIKKYEQLSDSASAARKQLPMLDYGLALINDPNIYQGILANEVGSWQKIKAAFPGFFGDDAKFAAAPNEVFNKVVSGSILDLMKSTLAGLGQVRVAEIDLLRQANASNTNTPAANRALLELSRRAMHKIDMLDDLGQQYFSGSEVVDPVSGKTYLKANLDANGEITPRRGLDVGFDKIARQWQLDNPTLSPEDIANYKEIFKTGMDPRRPDAPMPAKTGPGGGTTAPKGGAPAPSAPPKAGDTRMFDDGKGGQVEGVFDGKTWKPKK